MTQAVVAGALVVAALNLIPAAVGGWIWYRGDPSEPRGARLFWSALRVGQGSAIAFALAIGSLAAAGRSASEGLFYLYALLPLAVALVAEQLRLLSAQSILDQEGLSDAQAMGGLPEERQQQILVRILTREMGVMALSALVVSGLALRAATTAHGF